MTTTPSTETRRCPGCQQERHVSQFGHPDAPELCSMCRGNMAPTVGAITAANLDRRTSRGRGEPADLVEEVGTHEPRQAAVSPAVRRVPASRPSLPRHRVPPGDGGRDGGRPLPAVRDAELPDQSIGLPADAGVQGGAAVAPDGVVGDERQRLEHIREAEGIARRSPGALYQHSGAKRGIWWASYYVDGKRVRLSTGTSDLALAEAILRQLTGEETEMSSKGGICPWCKVMKSNLHDHQKRCPARPGVSTGAKVAERKDERPPEARKPADSVLAGTRPAAAAPEVQERPDCALCPFTAGPREKAMLTALIRRGLDLDVAAAATAEVMKLG